MESTEARLEGLIAQMPSLELQAKNLQAKEGDVAPDAVDQLRAEYLTWYAECLSTVPQDLQARFRDLYEGGAFISRIRHFIQAPTERSTLSSANPDSPPNPLIPYWSNVVGTTFVPSFVAQRQVLHEALEAARSGRGPAAAGVVEAIARRLPIVIAELQRRYDDRPGIAIDDEYDVQDIWRSLLVAVFDDVRPEEWTPSYAGGASRMDFLLKREGVVVEIKMTGPKVRAKELRDQLAIDLLRYQVHPDCSILVRLAYDPGRFITNPRGFEEDLTGPQGALAMRVAVVQG